MTEQNFNQPNKYSRFQVFIPESCGLKKTKSVGTAYLREGQDMYTVRLWMMSLERFYLVPDKSNPSKYFIMTREPSKTPESKNRFSWNIVGNAEVVSVDGVIVLRFDLIEKPIYMSIYPENSPTARGIQTPSELEQTA